MTETQARGYLWGFGERRLGKFGEAVFKNVFASSGLGFISLCDIENGRAPMIEGQQKTVLPDFEIVGGGWSAYLDAKCKKHSVLWRKTMQLRHGVLIRNYNDYKKTGILTRREAGVGIVELHTNAEENKWSGALLAESFRNLAEPFYGIPGTPLDDTVLWPRKQFVELTTMSAVELLNLANGRTKCDCRFELERIFNPEPSQVQQALFQ